MLSASTLAPQDFNDIQAVVVWLHGMGEEPMTMLDVAAASGLAEIGVESIALKAPMKHASQITGEIVDAWFDQEFAHLEMSNRTEFWEAVNRVDEYVDSLADHDSTPRLVIAGFSQGAALALAELMSHPDKFHAALLYSPYRVIDISLLSRCAMGRGRYPIEHELPRIWIGYGLRDWVIPARWSYSLVLELRGLGFDVVTHHYLGGHVPFGGAESDIRDFLISSFSSSR
ncbi:alpha/beta hydrolase-fold protein [uncultured Propionibacterium sp.]|uniref:alpha/beta hydrolase n=1 Tax=uncultured Propionibacterium sp. TaxID=218066 RepID=UPI00293003ED|nr:alpha/beta hydrolase-fold protein [uncultured Propionibacterium sp.]